MKSFLDARQLSRGKLFKRQDCQGCKQFVAGIFDDVEHRRKAIAIGEFLQSFEDADYTQSEKKVARVYEFRRDGARRDAGQEAVEEMGGEGSLLAPARRVPHGGHDDADHDPRGHDASLRVHSRPSRRNFSSSARRTYSDRGIGSRGSNRAASISS